MDERLTLSRYKLQTFLTCRRRFELRYRRRLPWPALPPAAEAAATMAYGAQFHRALERHFLGLPVDPALADERLRRWWALFRRYQPAVPNGRVLPEHTLTIPIGNHLLTGRFDLLVVGDKHVIGDDQGVGDERVVGENGPAPFAHIFDWKTGHPPGLDVLRDDWQTRLYLGMVAAGSAALLGRDQAIAPERITLTYWYTAVPEAPLVIRYDAAWHAQNWDDLQTILSELDAALAADVWPLTDNWDHCRHCVYQIYCGRQAAGESAVHTAPPESDDESLFPNLDPVTP